MNGMENGVLVPRASPMHADFGLTPHLAARLMASLNLNGSRSVAGQSSVRRLVLRRDREGVVRAPFHRIPRSIHARN
jgi:hypothetical protein